MGYRTFEHTADTGIEAWAPDLAELFREAARALFDTIIELAAVEPREPTPVAVQSEEPALLLHSWLSELLYLFAAEGRVFSRFEFSRLSETALEAVAYGEKFRDEKHRLKTDVKAITYHQLAVERTPSGWSARVILDL
jgi:SHS2 domain-containing protein